MTAQVYRKVIVPTCSTFAVAFGTSWGMLYILGIVNPGRLAIALFIGAFVGSVSFLSGLTALERRE